MDPAEMLGGTSRIAITRVGFAGGGVFDRRAVVLALLIATSQFVCMIRAPRETP